MSLRAIPSQVRADATALLVFVGEPLSYVEWSLSGSGSLEVLSMWTDAAGRASALYVPGAVGAAPRVTATHG